ncbi:hypothetical protein NPX13_g7817 [Xylaria arbuscula]|uniref:Uncharacterized protein n=1 Tax=Xylaria arbuscula TaxID=114810 RepID=A0A9W8NA64_9PEZI|nr:hypothetical protein NPX13_g7817 [Xylaria arbuscula]
MLVFLQVAPNPVDSHLQHLPDTTMAPPQLLPPSTLVFDGRTQIISNCKFLIGIRKGDTIEVVTSKDPTGKLFKALAVQHSEESREIFLESDHCENVQKALESLHTKSCEAIHEYTARNGLVKPRDLKLVFLEPNMIDDDAASIISGHSESSTAAISDWGNSSDEAMMIKHTSRTGVTSKDRQRPSGRPGHCMTNTSGDHDTPAWPSRSPCTISLAFLWV